MDDETPATEIEMQSNPKNDNPEILQVIKDLKNKYTVEDSLDVANFKIWVIFGMIPMKPSLWLFVFGTKASVSAILALKDFFGDHCSKGGTPAIMSIVVGCGYVFTVLLLFCLNCSICYTAINMWADPKSDEKENPKSDEEEMNKDELSNYSALVNFCTMEAIFSAYCCPYSLTLTILSFAECDMVGDINDGDYLELALFFLPLLLMVDTYFTCWKLLAQKLTAKWTPANSPFFLKMTINKDAFLILVHHTMNMSEIEYGYLSMCRCTPKEAYLAQMRYEPPAHEMKEISDVYDEYFKTQEEA